jgi:hypothetical protein
MADLAGEPLREIIKGLPAPELNRVRVGRAAYLVPKVRLPIVVEDETHRAGRGGDQVSLVLGAGLKPLDGLGEISWSAPLLPAER